LKQRTVQVKISEWRIADAHARLKSYSLGSCVGLVLWDPKKKIGAMAHILLPDSKNSRPSTTSAKFARPAVEILIEKLCQKGCARERLVAKMAGGANMFPKKFNPAQEILGRNIGFRNVRALRKILKEKSIPIIAQDVGGELGRTIEFNPKTGELIIYKSNGEVRVI